MDLETRRQGLRGDWRQRRAGSGDRQGTHGRGRQRAGHRPNGGEVRRRPVRPRRACRPCRVFWLATTPMPTCPSARETPHWHAGVGSMAFSSVSAARPPAKRWIRTMPRGGRRSRRCSSAPYGWYATCRPPSTTGGAIVLVLAVSAREAAPTLPISNGLRPGLALLAKNFADELGPRNIRVNTLLPNLFATGRGAAAARHEGAADRQPGAQARRRPGRVRAHGGDPAVLRCVLCDGSGDQHRRRPVEVFVTEGSTVPTPGICVEKFF